MNLLLKSRREIVLGGAALVLSAGLPARAQSTNMLILGGSAVQGGLVEGHVTPGSEVFVAGEKVRADGGLFCFGFNYNDTDAVQVRAVFADGTSKTQEVTPGTREFDVQRINGLPERYVSPPPEVAERISRDARVVVEARLHDIDETWFADEFLWPVEGIITGNFGNQRILNGEPRAPHYGVDIAVPEGTPIHAPANGIIRLAEDLYLSGNTMVIDHGHGVSTSYLHASRMDVKVGDRVNRGDVFAYAGQTGRATGPHVCWRMNWFQKRLDVALKAPERA
jgi:murein DD-endopeptidase MepM/ murein hydrolase activator NlpD